MRSFGFNFGRKTYPPVINPVWDDVNQALANYTINGRQWLFNTPELLRNLRSLSTDTKIIKFNILDGDIRSGDPTDRHRSELSGSLAPHNAVVSGERWIAYTMIPLKLATNVWTTLFQFFATSGTTGAVVNLDDRAGAETTINIAGNVTGPRVQVAAWEGPRFQLNRRYHIVWRIKPHPEYGELDFWVNGTLILSLRNVPIGFTTTPIAYDKYGIYADDNDLPMGELEVIFSPMEVANGVNALIDRIKTPSPIPTNLSRLYPMGAFGPGTKLIADGLGENAVNLFDTILPALNSDTGAGVFTYNETLDQLSLQGTGTSYGARAVWAIPTTEGLTYRVRGEMSVSTMSYRVGTTSGGTDILPGGTLAVGLVDFSWVGTGAIHYLRINKQNALSVSVLDDMSLIVT